MLRKNWKILLRIMGILLVGEGLLMMLCVGIGLYYAEADIMPFLFSALITLAVGVICVLFSPHKSGYIDKRMAYLIVTLVWVAMSLFGTLPFLATGTIDNFTDAFFEMMSGFTTAGATVFEDIEVLPKSLLFWRSLSQWIGGVGIVMLVLAIVPSLGINSYSLYSAELAGPLKDKTHNRVSATVRNLWITYLVLTVLVFAFLWGGDMDFFSAITHTFSAISSGGFSIYNSSISQLSAYSQYVLAVAMWLSGINLTLFYLFVRVKFSKLRSSLEQFFSYTCVFLLLALITTVVLNQTMEYDLPKAFRLAFVQAASVVSTCGFVVDDTTQWVLPINFLFLIFCLRGGMAGSTSGGLKVMRVLILEKNVRNVMRNRLHPNAVNPVRLNSKPVSDTVIYNVMTLFFVYCFTIVIALFLLILDGVSTTEALGAVVGAITSYGPGLAECGGFGNYAHFPIFSKWVLAFCMLAGRLECITVYMLFLPKFWKR